MSIAPGWYKDPAEPSTQRWWDGEGWVGDPQPADLTLPPGPPPPSASAAPHTGRPSDAVPPATPVPPPGEVPPHEPTRPPVAVPPGWPGRRPPPLAFGNPPRPHGHTLATLGARTVARLVDIGLVFLLNVLVNGWFVYRYWLEISPPFAEFWNRLRAGDDDMSDLPPIGDQAGALQFVILILAAALWFAYEVPAVANTGQTPGKRLLGIKVVRLEQAGPVGFGRSFRRWNTMGLPVLLWPCFGIGFVLQLVDIVFALTDRPLQQALHDKSSHTVVISVEMSGRPRETPDDQQADPS